MNENDPFAKNILLQTRSLFLSPFLSLSRAHNSPTVKLGYNELGYNEHSVITNKKFCPKWPFYNIKQSVYNEPRL